MVISCLYLNLSYNKIKNYDGFIPLGIVFFIVDASGRLKKKKNQASSTK